MGTFMNIAITLVVFSAATALFANYMGGMAQSYNTTAYTNDTFATYNQLSELQIYTAEIEANTMNARRSETSFSDLVTGYFTSAFQTVILSVKSFNIFNIMFNAFIVDLNLGYVGTIIQTTVATILLLVIVFGLIKLLTGGRDV